MIWQIPEKTFDRVVSVGMVEHVGRDNYQLFMDCVSKVLKDGGVFLLHFISALKEHPGDAWIKKYIFPGGMIPSLREMLSCAAEDNFHTLDVENLRLHIIVHFFAGKRIIKSILKKPARCLMSGSCVCGICICQPVQQHSTTALSIFIRS